MGIRRDARRGACMPQSDTHLIAFYLPQFHPIPENDAWWGKGFTEWRNVARAAAALPRPLSAARPGDLGFYDLRAAGNARASRPTLAREHGIHGFCYYHYWFNGRRLLQRPLDEVLAAAQPDFPFCVCWANENWTRRWDGHDDEILVAQQYSPEDDRRLASRTSLPLLPRPALHPRSRVAASHRLSRERRFPIRLRFAERFREQARRDGIADPFSSFIHLPGLPSPAQWGFDAAVEFPPHGSTWAKWTPSGRISISPETPR